jgi:hypothetical protein
MAVTVFGDAADRMLKLRVGDVGLGPLGTGEDSLEPFEPDAARLDDGSRARSVRIPGASLFGIPVPVSRPSMARPLAHGMSL